MDYFAIQLAAQQLHNAACHAYILQLHGVDAGFDKRELALREHVARLTSLVGLRVAA